MESYGICTSRHVRKVSLVVTAIDDFTGKAIIGSNIRVWIEREKPPIKKSDGWNVFMNLPTGEHIINADGGFYNRTSVVCRVDSDSYTSIKLRLTPSKNAPLPSKAAMIEGKASPGARLLVYPTDRALSYKLLAGTKVGDDTLAVFHPDGTDIEGKLLCLNSQGSEDEFVRVVRTDEDGRSEYLLSRPISVERPKIGTLIFPVSECIADQKGEFFLPVGALTSKESEFVCICEGDTSKRAEFSLSPGSRVRIEI